MFWLCSSLQHVQRWSTSSVETLDVLQRWDVMAHAKKPDFVLRWNGRVHLNRRGRQFSRLLAVEVCASAVVMLDTPCSEVVWRVLATHSIRQFPLHFPSRASPRGVIFQVKSTQKIIEGVQGTEYTAPRTETDRSVLFKKVDNYHYSHAPHTDVSVNGGPHIRRWSHKNVIF